MYILYVDESGDNGAQGSKHYVLGAVCVPEEKIETLQGNLNSLVKNTFKYWKRVHVPDMYLKDEFKNERTGRHKKIMGDLPLEKPELHYKDLICGNPPYDKLEKLSRKHLADGVLGVIPELDLKLFGVVINKEKHWGKYLIPKPVELFALEMLAERFQSYLTTINGRGLIIYDHKDKENNKIFLNFVNFIRTKGTTFTDLARISENIMFTPSDLCEGLQLADFVAHTIFMSHESGRSNRLDQIKQHFFSIKCFPSK